MRPSEEQDQIQEIRRLLREAGLRCTAARMAVMQQLHQTTAPVTHAELAEELVPLGFDKATVYRNLIDLSEVGLVIRTELGDHLWRFELRNRDASHSGEHPHFVCVDCGSVTCLPEARFSPLTKKKTSQIGRVTEVLLKGLCRNCD